MSYYNFLHEYRPYALNNHGMLSMNDEQAKHAFKQYAEYGYVIIATKCMSEMIDLLKQGKYSYMPVYAKFSNNYRYEKAIIIFNCHCGYNIHQAGDAETLQGLLELGKSLAIQFHQEFFLFQEPQKALRCVDREGNEHHLEDTLGNMESPDFNEFTKPYWIALKGRLASKIKVIGLSEDQLRMRKVRRLEDIAKTFVGCYINPAPASDRERVIRVGAKEIFPGI
ncbi:MAG: hypothetical protein J6R26_08405 [Paludibacteraceae bacterium]|nr:hypothetical protein [Paludibacteraceae bacterium]